jgi:hypothetical protein
MYRLRDRKPAKPVHDDRVSCIRPPVGDVAWPLKSAVNIAAKRAEMIACQGESFVNPIHYCMPSRLHRLQSHHTMV